MRVSFRSWSYIAKDITCETPWFNRFLGLNGQGGEQSMAAHGGGGPLPHFSCRVVFFTSFDETCKRSAWLQKPLGSRHTLRPTHLCPINFPSTSYLGPFSGNSFLAERRKGTKGYGEECSHCQSEGYLLVQLINPLKRGLPHQVQIVFSMIVLSFLWWDVSVIQTLQTQEYMKIAAFANATSPYGSMAVNMVQPGQPYLRLFRDGFHESIQWGEDARCLIKQRGTLLCALFYFPEYYLQEHAFRKSEHVQLPLMSCDIL